MIKTSFKNFFKNLIYVFIPMGILYLFLLIAVFSLAGTAFNAVSNAVSDMAQLVGESVEQSEVELQQFLSEAFAKIDWNGNIFVTIKTIIETKWLTTTVQDFFRTLNQTTEGFDEELAQIIAQLKNSIVGGVAIAGVLSLLGVICANYATRFAVRSRLAVKRNFKQFVVAYTLVPLFQTVLLVASLALLATIRYYSLIVFFVFVALIGVVSLCSSYLVYRNNSLKLKDVLTVKNVLKHLAVLCILAVINIALALLLWQLSPLFALLLVVPLVIYSANIADVNTDCYVCSLVEQSAPAAIQQSNG